MADKISSPSGKYTLVIQDSRQVERWPDGAVILGAAESGSSDSSDPADTDMDA
ncbi:hypothetical protein IU500_19210 [Nocardia terpenica]|uniref:hypothetical protein n=1 Tax=Nocardia terpenica TaxID=455432 RepID=UPI0018938FD4|nr:hypothetical protein [Nocardia terpenica]MBF6062032.1 hypothetical protein [Nocardia terpenica]MBF6106168.1 hypothetical protein [Nocardia terpenica]MBF6110452.1 hypothetical protein [Nocardia terpenica]MBF6120711.1 hypothetical protein [Nocardia terpenica]MBF6151788.1 hypothetical protein [Nocardia terpenica]